jgi:hypothetical protein
MKKIFLLAFGIIAFINLFSQTSIENYVEGRKYKDRKTGLIIQYGYISSLNTYGLTFTNTYGRKYYHINCSKRISSDKSFMVLEGCLNLDDGLSMGKFYVYQSYIKSVDTGLQFDLVVENNTINENPLPDNSSNSGTKTIVETPKKIGPLEATQIKGTPKKIGILQVAEFDFNQLITIKKTKEACASLGAGWRLPTKAELILIYINQDIIGNFGTGIYLSSENVSNYNAISFIKIKGEENPYVYPNKSLLVTFGANAGFMVRAVKNDSK